MNINEAIAECKGYIQYLERQRKITLDMQKISMDVRNNKITPKEARRRMNHLRDPSPTVYDGANLEKAIKVLLSVVDADIEQLKALNAELVEALEGVLGETGACFEYYEDEDFRERDRVITRAEEALKKAR